MLANEGSTLPSSHCGHRAGPVCLSPNGYGKIYIYIYMFIYIHIYFMSIVFKVSHANDMNDTMACQVFTSPS